jgi:hypothetical protein
MQPIRSQTPPRKRKVVEVDSPVSAILDEQVKRMEEGGLHVRMTRTQMMRFLVVRGARCRCPVRSPKKKPQRRDRSLVSVVGGTERTDPRGPPGEGT